MILARRGLRSQWLATRLRTVRRREPVLGGPRPAQHFGPYVCRVRDGQVARRGWPPGENHFPAPSVSECSPLKAAHPGARIERGSDERPDARRRGRRPG